MAADGSGGWVNRGGPEPAGRRHDVILPGGYDSEYANNTGQSIRPRTLERGSSTEGTSIRRAPPPPAVAEAAVRPLFIEGYTTSVSYAPGETVFFCVSTSAPSFAATVHRVGAVRTLVWASPENKPLPGTSHEVPEDCSSTGCGWPVTFAVPVGNDWESGYYEATLHAEDDGGEFSHRGRRTADGVAHFIVRAKSSRPKANILLQLATNTYAAYNNYGGTCFYGGFGRGGMQGHKVSFDRPCAGLFYKWEVYFVVWAEQNGYQLDYAANSDLEERPELTIPPSDGGYRLILSIGHDEYWSSGMRDKCERFIMGGGNMAFFAGNAVCWRVRSEDNGRSLVCWKQWYNYDEAWAHGKPSELTTLWSHELLARPENQLTGVGFLHGGYHRAHGFFVEAFESEFTPGTALPRGAVFGERHTVVGYECDGCDFVLDGDGLPVPTCNDGTPPSFQILATAPARWAVGDGWWYEGFDREGLGHACLGVYQNTPTSGTVFTAGSTDWVHGLAGPEMGDFPKAYVTFATSLRRSHCGPADKTVKTITINILERLSSQNNGSKL